MAFQWHGKRFVSELRLVIGANLQAAAYHLQNKIRHNLSVANSPRVRLRSGAYVGLAPSKPGEPPRKLSGHLRRTIATELSADKTVARVGTNLPYGKFLELGTKGGRTIVAGPGKAIPIAVRSGSLPQAKPGRSVSFKAGNFIFRKVVRIGPIAPRPFLTSTLMKERDTIARIAAVNRTL